MNITISEDEAEALILMRRMLRTAATPVPIYLNWLADRMVMVYKEPSSVDFVQCARERAQQLSEISHRLGINRVV